MTFWCEIFSEIFNRSITAGIVILGVLAVRFFLRRAPKKFSYMLWGIVLFRLLCPVFPESVFSLLNLSDVSVTDHGEWEDVYPDTDSGRTDDMLSGLAGLEPMDTTGVSSASADKILADEANADKNFADKILAGEANADKNLADKILADEANADKNFAGKASADETAAGIAFTGKTSADSASIERFFGSDSSTAPLIFVLICIWLSGMAFMTLYGILSAVRLHRQVACSMRLRDNIYLADKIPSPFVFGLLRPRIYLPSALDGKEWEYIILHEQHHIQRRDHLVKSLAYLALCVYWFHPLVWVAFALAGKDMEMSCDEAVMEKTGRDIRAEYAASLLQLTIGKRRIAGAPLAFGAGNPKRRIKNIMNYKKPALWMSAIGAVVCVIVAVCFLTDPVVKRGTMKWAKELSADDVSAIELVVMPGPDNMQYQLFSRDEFGDIVRLINQSRGRYLKEYEDTDGGSISFYITMTDGSKHTVVNIGNSYLYIDGDYYDAGYNWLSSWDVNYGKGNADLPPGLFGQNGDRDSAIAFQAKIVELEQGSMLVEPMEGVREWSLSGCIRIPVEHMTASPEPEVGDIVEIYYNGTIMESDPAQLGEVYGIEIVKKGGSDTDVLPEAVYEEEEAITKAIMEHHHPADTEDYDYACCSFVQLESLSATPVAGSTTHRITYYGWVLYEEYDISDEGITNVGSSHLPAALTFELNENGYTLQEYWEPRSGSYYVPDIQEKFPAHITADSMDSQKFIDRQIQDCYAQTVAYGHLDTDVIIEKLLDTICSGPGRFASSNPQEYIDAHVPEHRELYYYGNYTVRYCLNRFEQGGETGLEGHIMARICEEILDLEGKIPTDAGTVSTGQKWYDALQAHGSNVIEDVMQGQ